MMGSRYCDDLFDATEIGSSVGRFEPGQKSNHGSRADRHMSPDFDVALTEFPGDDTDSLSARGVHNPQKIIGQPRTEFGVDATDERGTGGRSPPAWGVVGRVVPGRRSC